MKCRKAEWKEVMNLDNEDSIVTVDDLDFIKQTIRADNDISELIHAIKTTGLSIKTLKSLYAEALGGMNRKEKSIRTLLSIRSEEIKEFEKERKIREEADINGFWKPIFEKFDKLNQYDKLMLADLLATFEINKVILEKMYNELNQGYAEGWGRKINDDVKSELLTMGARFDELCDIAKIKPEQRLAEKNRRITDLEEKLRLATLTEKEKKEEWSREVMEKTLIDAKKPLAVRDLMKLAKGIGNDAKLTAIKQLIALGKVGKDSKNRCVPVSKPTPNVKNVPETAQVYNQKRGEPVQEEPVGENEENAR